MLAARTYRTAAGRLAVDTVDQGAPERISDGDARRAGHADATTPIGDLRGEEGQPVFRIAFRHLPEPDPRTVLVNDDALDPEAIAAIPARLDRLDRSSSHGPWTRSYLEVIESNPERRAPDLAGMFGARPSLDLSAAGQ